MKSLYVNLGNNDYAVIEGTGGMGIWNLQDDVIGDIVTWRITERCLEWCEDNGIPTNGDGTITGIEA